MTDIVKLAQQSIDDASHWPTDWGVEMHDVDGDDQPSTFRCFVATGRDGGTDEMCLGSEDYDDKLATYIATMNKREPVLAAAILKLEQELVLLRVAYKASKALRACETASMVGETIAELEPQAEAAAKRTIRELTRWRTVMDEVIADEEKTS